MTLLSFIWRAWCLLCGSIGVLSITAFFLVVAFVLLEEHRSNYPRSSGDKVSR